MYKILVINPGSTSTKLALFYDEKNTFVENIHHPARDLAAFENIVDQLEYRYQIIQEILFANNISIAKMDAFVARGGLLKAIPGGTYIVDPAMLADLRKGVQGQHASNLGGILAQAFARESGKSAYIVDPVVVDELDAVARLTGHPQFKRKSIFHALNHKAVARKAAAELKKDYTETNLIIAHLGGGISVAAHKQGKVVDVNNALDGEGPYAPERSGTLPAGDLVRWCFSGAGTQAETLKMITGKGGIVAYAGTNDLRVLQQQIDLQNDVQAELFIKGMTYQVAKEISAMGAVFNGKVDAIVLTGGIANNTTITNQIIERVGYIAPVKIYPGEQEMEALALGALRVLQGLESPKLYEKEAALHDNVI